MKKVFSLIFAFVIALSLSVSVHAAGNKFKDVPSNHWAKNEIEYFAEKNIVNGIGEDLFAPTAGVTREQFCKMLVLTFNAAISSPASPTFSDVNESKWSYQYVETSKDFLTGYSSPFGGLPAFHPEEDATREDIAVALVRMLGLTEADAKDKNYAYYKFSDGGSISPALLGYVSIACEKGLITGYTDGTFGPTKGISRAETVVLLNRATKQAVTTIEQELDVSASVAYSKDGKTATLHVEGEAGITVTVNGEKISMSNNGYDKYEGVYTYTFAKEGSKDFVITATKAGKTKTLNITAKYEIGVPVLSITQCPTTATSKNVTIKGTLTDSSNNKATLTINGKSVDISTYGGSWSESFILNEGTNTFIFSATNSAGKSVEETKTIIFSPSAPILVIKQCPTEVSTRSVVISGTMFDADYHTVLYINNEVVKTCEYAGQATNWSELFTLKDGKNTFTITLVNDLGKTVTDTRVINYAMPEPKLTVNCPSEVTTKSATISGTAFDPNYITTVKINGREVSSAPYANYNMNWSKTVDLQEGKNTFEIALTNSAGKTVSETRVINYAMPGPELTISCPSEVTTNSVTISGTAFDPNYTTTLMVNGLEVASAYYTNYKLNWSKTFTLQEGDNSFVFVLKNSAGKSTTETRTVHFSAGKPEIVFTNCPETTQRDTLYIDGKIGGTNNGAKLYVNDEPTSLNAYSFSKKVVLSEGSNTFIFRAVNSYGQSTTVVKTIKYVAEILPPVLTVNDIPESTRDSLITVSGTIEDNVDSSVLVYVNDKRVSTGNGSWSTSVSLDSGKNTIIVTATNAYGKSITVTKTVSYIPAEVSEE